MLKIHRLFFLVLILCLGLGLPLHQGLAQQNPEGLALPGTAKIPDQFLPLIGDEYQFQGGLLGDRYDISWKQRLLNVDENDLLGAFEQHNIGSMEWQGEHVGKFLHAATLVWANTHDADLRTKIDRVVARLLKTQGADGYLGTYPDTKRWTAWDVWGQKYVLLGLLTYYQYTHDESALTACRHEADLLLHTFGTGPGQLHLNTAGQHLGLAPDSILEPMVLLYRATGDQRYETFCEYIVAHYDDPDGAALLSALGNSHSVTSVRDAKAYEMLSNCNGVLELYRATGNPFFIAAMRSAWTDVVQHHLYITGSGSKSEYFSGENSLPNVPEAHICETCLTVTWEQMNLQLLRLTGESSFADEIERSVYNHLLAAQKPTGDDWCYYTPLEGHKQYDRVTTCCHSSGPRGLALLTSAAMMKSADGGVVVNLYNPGKATTRLPSGGISLVMQTRYPLDGTISLQVDPEHDGQQFPLRLRIPAWADHADLTINRAEQPQLSVQPGHYCVIDRTWKRHDLVTLVLPVAKHLQVGQYNNTGRGAVMWGPLVLALDASENKTLSSPLSQVELLTDKSSDLDLTLDPQPGTGGSPVFHASGRVPGADSAPLTFVPFAFAGQTGGEFEVWISLPGQARSDSRNSVLAHADISFSRQGNHSGSLVDGDVASFTVTANGAKADEDWYAATLPAPVVIDRLVFAHGMTFGNGGGWFDTSAPYGKPRVQVQTEPGGEWKTIATLAGYPDTTATNSGGLDHGEFFTAQFDPVTTKAIRVAGKPGGSQETFSSCAELQAFGPLETASLK